MSKYFLVNNKQEWIWLMKKFEAENSEIKWCGQDDPTDFVPHERISNLIIELGWNDATQNDKTLVYDNKDKFSYLSFEQIIEVNRLMEGENNG